jgi:hypothetical protein
MSAHKRMCLKKVNQCRQNLKAKKERVRFLKHLILSWEMSDEYEANKKYVRGLRRRLRAAEVQLSAMKP